MDPMELAREEKVEHDHSSLHPVAARILHQQARQAGHCAMDLHSPLFVCNIGNGGNHAHDSAVPVARGAETRWTARVVKEGSVGDGWNVDRIFVDIIPKLSRTHDRDLQGA